MQQTTITHREGGSNHEEAVGDILLAVKDVSLPFGGGSERHPSAIGGGSGTSTPAVWWDR